jgi:hypothetical protein
MESEYFGKKYFVSSNQIICFVPMPTSIHPMPSTTKCVSNQQNWPAAEYIQF